MKKTGKVIRIKEYIDGGPNDNGFIIGHMKYDENFLTKKGWYKAPTDSFKSEFKRKFNKNFHGNLGIMVIDKSEYDKYIKNLKNKLENHLIK